MSNRGHSVPRNNFFKIDVCESGELVRFLNRQEVCRLGKPVTKSMEISSHFHCGILGC
uniref:Uncharacterized protein n=1 Tax=Helianthus annuus TaxID=4232 RepID=A0A251UYT9_HELAN